MMVWTLGKEREGLNRNLDLIKGLCVPSTVLHSQYSVNHSLRSDQLSPQFGVEENQINIDIRWPDKSQILCWWSQKLKQDWSSSQVEAQAGEVRRWSQLLIWAEPWRGQREAWGQRAGKGDREKQVGRERNTDRFLQKPIHSPKEHLPPRGGLSLQLVSTWRTFLQSKDILPYNHQLAPATVIFLDSWWGLRFSRLEISLKPCS